VNAAIAAFYYLRVVVYMYMREAPEGAPPIARSAALRAGLAIAAILTVAIGLFPTQIAAAVEAAAKALL